MSMAAVLATVRDRLRTEIPLAVEQCGIQPGGTPPSTAGEMYVAVDELGVVSDGKCVLRETYSVEVCLWRRIGQFPGDRLGDVHLKEDPYVATARTLDVVERDVLRLIHANYLHIVAAANEAAAAGTPAGGDVFQLALYYEGRSRTESFRPAKGAWRDAWLGRRLKFSGLTRVQANPN